MNSPLPKGEDARLEALRRYDILNTEVEQAFNDITLLASQICRTPIALVSFVDAERLWFKSKTGLGMDELPRDLAFCAHAILQPDLFIVQNALADERFASNSIVTSDPHVRFYAGVTLTASDGYALGTLCVIDHASRELSPEQLEALRALGRQVMALLELRRNGVELSRINKELRSEVGERKLAKKRLRESEALYGVVMETTSDAIITVDEKSTILFANTATEKIFGYPVHELIGAALTKLMPDYLHHFHEAGMKRYNETGRKHIDWAAVEVPGLHLNGKEIPLEISFGESVHNGGHFFTGIIRDITERRHAEAVLRKSEEYRNLFRHANDSILIFDPEGEVVLDVNDKACEIYGLAREEFIGRSIIEMSQDAYQGEESLRELRSKGACHSFETTQWRADGTAVNFLVNASVIEFQGRQAVLSINRDITEWKRKERELREAEVKFQVVVESLGEGLIITDFADRVLYINSRLTELTGYTLEEMKGNPAYQFLLSPEQWPNSLKRNEKRQKGVAESYELQVQRKDGIWRWMAVNAAPYRNPSGEIIGTIGAMTDIAESKRAAEALLESEENYRLLVENSPAIVWSSWQNGTLRFISPNVETIVGYTPEEMYDSGSKLWFARMHPDDVGKVKSSYISLFETNDYFDVEYRIQRRDGEWIWLHDRALGITEKDGVRYTTGITIDITERTQTAEALRQSERQLRTVVAGAPIILYSLDRNGIFTLSEGSGLGALGLKPGEVVGRSVYEVYHDEPQVLEHFMRVLGGETFSATAEVGDLVFEAQTTPIRNRDGEIDGMMGVATNITERRRAEEALRQSEERLRQAQKLEGIGQLAGGIAHDFNNLLVIINGYSDLLLRGQEEGETARQKIVEIKKAGERAASLTRQLLAFSRKQVMQPKLLDLNTVVKNIGKMLQRLIGEDIELSLILKPALGPVSADPGQLEQVIINLVVNARDAMPQGGKLIIETDNVSLSEEYARRYLSVRPGSYVSLAVSDTGCGIDAATQARIFEPFFTTKEMGKGTGLGLSTVYGVVKQSGGHISVYSEQGVGTTFKVYLARVEDPISSEEQVERSEVPRGSETILLVEDESVVRCLTRDLLELSGYTVLEAASGEEALHAYEQFKEPIQLLLTDVIMPGMSGHTLAQNLIGRCPSLRVLYMSGYTDEAIARHGILEPGLSLLEKPFLPDILIHKVREVLDRVCA